MIFIISETLLTAWYFVIYHNGLDNALIGRFGMELIIWSRVGGLLPADTCITPRPPLKRNDEEMKQFL